VPSRAAVRLALAASGHPVPGRRDDLMLSPVIATAQLRSKIFFCARARINPSQRVLRDRRDAEPKPRFDIFPRGARAQSALSTLSHPWTTRTERPPSLWTMPRVSALPQTASAAPCPFPIGDSHPTTTWRDWWGSGLSANRSSEVPAAMGGRLLLNSIESRNLLELALGKRQITQLRLFRYCYHHLKCSKLSKMHSETEYHPFNHRSKYRHLDKE
jgi:hypothetical protein